MGILSSLFGKKATAKEEHISARASDQKKETSMTASFHLRGKPDANGLYPSELIMLSLAEHYKINETIFPGYLIHTYEIANPSKMLKSLQAKGLIDVGSPKDVLLGFKLPELKEIASSLGLTAKGKKADIIAQLSDVKEEELGARVKERSWKLTDNGQAVLKENPYIHYFLEKHPYNVNDVGVDIWSVNEEFIKNPKRPYRDLIYRQLNSQMNKASIAFQKDPMSGSANTYKYCECYRIMGLFIEEEGKSFVNAADLYFQYLFKRINIHAGLQLLKSYKLYANDKKYQNESIQRYYEDIQLLPFHKTEFLRLIDELDVENTAVRDALITSFKKANDTGIMNEQEAADFVLFEINGEVDKSRDLAIKLAKKAVKKI